MGKASRLKKGRRIVAEERKQKVGRATVRFQADFKIGDAARPWSQAQRAAMTALIVAVASDDLNEAERLAEELRRGGCAPFLVLFNAAINARPARDYNLSSLAFALGDQEMFLWAFSEFTGEAPSDQFAYAFSEMRRQLDSLPNGHTSIKLCEACMRALYQAEAVGLLSAEERKLYVESLGSRSKALWFHETGARLASSERDELTSATPRVDRARSTVGAKSASQARL